MSRLLSAVLAILFVMLFTLAVNAGEKGRAYYDLGVFAHESGDYEEAEKNLKKAIELNPDDPLYNHYLGKTYLKMERYDEAMIHLSHVWSVNPAITGLKYDLAFGHYKMENYSSAADLFEQIVKEDPANVLANYHGGLSLFKEKQYEKALDYFLHASEMSPTIKINGTYYAGLCYLKLGNYDRAVERLEYVKDNTSSESLKEHALQWLEAIEKEKEALKPYLLYAKIGYGYDDNINFGPLDEDIVSNEEDFLTTAYLTGQYHFVNRKNIKFSAGYNHYQTLYNQLNEYDLGESTPHFNVKYRFFPFTIGLRYLYSYYWLDSERYLRRHRFIPEIVWKVNENFLTRLKYSYYDNEHFQDDRRDADNHEVLLLLDYRKRFFEKEVNLVGEIGWEENKASHPDIDYGRVKARASLYFMGPWQFSFRLAVRYEDKTYDNTDSFFNVKREDDRYEGSVLISHRFYYDFLSIQSEYKYIRNNSNISDFEYKKNAIGLFLTFKY